MQAVSRRSFLKTSALGLASGALILDGGWLSHANGAAMDYFAAEFGISDGLCEKVLAKALARGGDFADLFFEHTISNYLILEDGKVNRAYGEVALGVGIRTVKGDQVGYGYTQELEEKSMLAAAATAATIADGTTATLPVKFSRVSLADRYPLKKLYSAVPLSDKLPLVQSANDKCFALSGEIIKVNATLNDQQKRILIVTSDGVKAEDLQPNSFLAASVTAERNGRRERAGYNFGGRREFSFYTPALVDELCKEAVSRVLVLFDAVKPPAGEMPVVFGPGVTGILLHEAIGHGMEADFNRKKISTFATMIGKKVAEPFVNIVDDATNERLPGSLNVDDEGTPGQKTLLVENGILTSYLHDKISARHYRVNSTGSGRRQSYEHFVQPRMRNTYMLAGPASPEEVIGSVQKGIYIKDVSNGQVKIGEGDFAFYVSQGQMIEDGKLTAPIKDVNIMGNGPKMLANITMLANDLQMNRGGAGMCGKGGQGVPVGFGQPTCRVQSLTVGGTQA
ncbi:MAG TPA: TldD/PmbA family protein [bacterium]|nr:TldD/PmbA family protein [bacterium]HOY44144.1 TldD/PmbA family protein [bacterium]HPG82180.1 TldD/PmbA family protein [bacterium]HPM59242.1 TldD/PmbA family protein [bacterium]